VSNEFETSPEVLEIIDKCSNKDKLRHTLTFIYKRLDTEGTPLRGHMWQSLCNHVAAMVERSVSGEKLEGFDENMFDEIGIESKSFARDVTASIGNLANNESLLLSVHFERAKIPS